MYLLPTSQPWLPSDAVARAVVALPVEASVRAWLTNWFTDSGKPVVRLLDRSTTAPSDAGWSWSLGEDIMVTARADLALDAALVMTGAPADAAVNDADRTLLERIAEPCLDDLRQRLGLLIAGAEPWRPLPVNDHGKWWRWSVTRENIVLTVAVAEAMIVRTCLAALPPARAPRPPRPLAVALADQELDVSGYAGPGRITTAEFAALAVGDVVVLDRSTTDPVQLAVDRRPTPMRCTIDLQDEAICLVVVSLQQESVR